MSDYKPPRRKHCNTEYFNFLAIDNKLYNNNLITDSTDALKVIASIINTPIIIFDFDYQLKEYKNAVNCIYYGDYLSENVKNLIDARIERHSNKAERVTIILNSLDDYKVDLNYILKRGEVANVNLILKADTIPKKAKFKASYYNNVLQVDGVTIE